MPTRRLTRQLIWQLLLYTLLFGVAVITLKAVVVWRDGQRRWMPSRHGFRLYLPLLGQSAWDVDIPAIQLQLRLIGQIPACKAWKCVPSWASRCAMTIRNLQDQTIENILPLASPHGKDSIGTCNCWFRASRSTSHVAGSASATLQFLLGFFGLALLLWWLFNRQLVKPLQDMAQTVRNYQPGKRCPAARCTRPGGG
jgi:hypothetical protein